MQSDQKINLEQGAVFVNLTAVYDTVNHNALLQKIYYQTKDWKFVQIVTSLLQNCRFLVTLKAT